MIDLGAMRQLSAALQVEQQINTRDNSYIRCSSIGECGRKIGYRVRGELAPPPNSHSLTVFDVGHGIHLQLQQRLSNVGVLKWVDAEPALDYRGRFHWRGNCELNVRSDTYRLMGHLDALSRPLRRIRWEDGTEILEPTDEADPEGCRYVIDIKSIGTRDYIFYQENGEIEKIVPSQFEKLEKPKVEHVQQTSIYAWMTTQPGFSTDRIAVPLPKIPDVMIIYVGKDLAHDFYEKQPKLFPPGSRLNTAIKVHTFPVDLAAVEAYLAKVQKIWSYLDGGKLPPRDYQHSPHFPANACLYCDYNSRCWEREGYFTSTSDPDADRLVHHLLQLQTS